MKRICDSSTPRLNHWALNVSCLKFLPLIAAFLVQSAVIASAATSGLNPYSGIVERNAFGLKPPVNPADLIKPPVPVVADIKLQGITTILGKKQVLMKIKVPAKPPEPAKEQSFVFTEGWREGEVEVKEIDPVTETVKVDNGGTLLSLNMKEHGERPAPGAAAPATGSPLPGAVPGLPPPVRPPGSSAQLPNNSGGAGAAPVTAFGGASPNTSSFGSTSQGAATSGNAGQMSIPTRSLRTSAASGASSGAANEFQNVSPEAQAILIEAQRTQIQAGGFDPLPKTVITPPDRMQAPPHPQP